MRAFPLLLIAAPFLAAGCVGDLRVRDDAYYDRRPYVAAPPPRPVYVTPAPAYPSPPPAYVPAPVPPPAPIVVREAPPPRRIERPPPAPGPGFVWISGYWVREGRRWVWIGGHWDRPPRPDARWDAPRWERSGVEFHFHAGGWH
jgi:hypothetical protein